MKHGMLSRKIFFSLLLCAGLLFNCDDDVPWLEFPADLVSRHYKIGNVASGENPTDPQAFLDSIQFIEDLSNGGSEDIAVITVPVWVNWEGHITQEVNDLCLTLRNYDMEINFLVDPLPMRYYLGGQTPPPPGNNFANESVRQTFKDYTMDAMTKIDPEYITLGVELNMYYRDATIEDFTYLNSLINETADLVRATSPDTKVMTTFQWENIFLVAECTWEPIENYEWNVDIFGISTFPMGALRYLDPSRLPETYYSQIYDHLPPNITPETLTLAFSEVGFPSNAVSTGQVDQDGSEMHQSNGLVTIIQHHANQFERLEFINYWYLHDNAAFAGMPNLGLIESTATEEGIPGRKRAAYYIWEQLGNLTYVP